MSEQTIKASKVKKERDYSDLLLRNILKYSVVKRNTVFFNSKEYHRQYSNVKKKVISLCYKYKLRENPGQLDNAKKDLLKYLKEKKPSYYINRLV